MKILCIDVGRGTQDILLYDNDKSIENCVSLIIPSRGALLEEAFRQAISEGKTPLFWGINMGGFPVFKYMQKGKKVLATHSSAKTFKDNPEFLIERGFSLVSEQEATQLKNSPDISLLETKDIDYDKLQTALLNLGDNAQIDGFAVAVQDHGESPEGVSNRQFRFEQHKKLLDNFQHINQLSFTRNQIPQIFTRMRAVSDSLPQDKPLVTMDTGWAAILGTLDDPVVAGKERKLVVNLGNAHALAAYLKGDTILGLWEHHTGNLNSEKLKYFLTKLAEGTITHEEIFNDGGHGAYIKQNPEGMSKVDLIALTGPNRIKFPANNYYLAAPHGNMMLTGSFGLLQTYKYQILKDKEV